MATTLEEHWGSPLNRSAGNTMDGNYHSTNREVMSQTVLKWQLLYNNRIGNWQLHKHVQTHDIYNVLHSQGVK